jgi:hypothetical protein
MIHYTAIPLETVFEGFEENKPVYMTANINGIEMQLEALNPRQARIVRLLSPNPQDYLLSCYSPGTVIDFVPQIHT